MSTDIGDVTVLGTSFGVSVYKGEIGTTTLVSGKVKFTSKNGMNETLSPGEQVSVAVSGLVEKRMVNVEEYVGWKSGLFVFKNKTLEEIMNMFERCDRWIYCFNSLSCGVCLLGESVSYGQLSYDHQKQQALCGRNGCGCRNNKLHYCDGGFYCARKCVF